MTVAISAGAAGLTGSEAALHLGLGYQVVGIDNKMRHLFFGSNGFTEWDPPSTTVPFGQLVHAHRHRRPRPRNRSEAICTPCQKPAW